MICYDAFKNVYIEQGTEVKVSACCVMFPTQPVTEQNLLFNPNLNEVRQSFLANEKPNQCNNCWRREDAGQPSRRSDGTQWYVDNGYDNTTVELISVDYWVGNLCNLKCVMCGPESSTAWQTEEDPKRVINQYHRNQVWKSLDLSKLRLVHFTGGEPLLSEDHVEFLQAIPDKKQVTVNYNTNGTVMPSAELIALWSEFHLVQIDFSIDDIGERFEYIRFPAKWNEVVDTMDRIRAAVSHNTMFAINTTLTVLNEDTYPELVAWAKQKYGNDIDLRTQYAHGILDCRRSKIDNYGVKRYLTILDHRRSNSYEIAFPHLVKPQ